MLHIINKSPFNSQSLADCLRFATSQDAILLIEDGVYAGIENSLLVNSVKSTLKKTSIYLLKEDAHARGITNKLIDGIKILDYAGFVDLTVSHHPIQTWS